MLNNNRSINQSKLVRIISIYHHYGLWGGFPLLMMCAYVRSVYCPPGCPISSSNKTDPHDIPEIWLILALKTWNLSIIILFNLQYINVRWTILSEKWNRTFAHVRLDSKIMFFTRIYLSYFPIMQKLNENGMSIIYTTGNTSGAGTVYPS